MKKIFILLIMLFIGSSFMVHAQYINKEDSTQESISQTPNLFDLPEYQQAQEKIKTGKLLSIGGLGLTTVGSLVMALAPALEPYDYEGVGTDIAIISGAVVSATGLILSVIGAFEWTNGAATVRDIKFMYSLSGNGLLISF